MSALEFIIFFILEILLGSVFIIGWYAITRGRVEQTITGEYYRTGKIFKAWHFYWNDHTDSKRIIRGIPLEKKFVLLKKEGIGNNIVCRENHIEILNSEDFFVKNIVYLKAITGASEIQIKNGCIYLYGTLKEYIFPEWVRDPLSECPTCMASVYGTFFYWIFYFLSKNYDINFIDDSTYIDRLSIFNWTISEGLSAIFFWVVYCISLAFLNTVLAKKL